MPFDLGQKPTHLGKSYTLCYTLSPPRCLPPAFLSSLPQNLDVQTRWGFKALTVLSASRRLMYLALTTTLAGSLSLAPL